MHEPVEGLLESWEGCVGRSSAEKQPSVAMGTGDLLITCAIGAPKCFAGSPQSRGQLLPIGPAGSITGLGGFRCAFGIFSAGELREIRQSVSQTFFASVGEAACFVYARASRVTSTAVCLLQVWLRKGVLPRQGQKIYSISSTWPLYRLI